MEVKTVDELLTLRKSLKASQNKKTTFTFECQRCHKKVERRIFAKSTDLLCKGCLAKKTNLEKFGVENPSQAKEIKEKKKQTSLKHFGTENPMQSKEVVETLKKSNLEKFGVDNAAKLDSVKEKMKATNKEKYGEEFFAKTDGYKNACKKAWEKKSKEELKEIEEKRKATCKEIYGDENFNNRISFRESLNKNYEEELKTLEKENGKLLTVSSLCEKYDFDPTYVIALLEKNNLKIKGKYRDYLKESDLEKWKKIIGDSKGGTSKKEKDLLDFVKSIYKGEIIENSKKILNGLELDIFLPEKNLAIEFNGLYWHSDKAAFNIPTKEEKEHAKYRHLEKTKLCEEKGIHLIHIFEDDWDFKQNIVKSILNLQLNKGNVIFARNCDLQELDLETYKKFLEENHLQGFSFADLRLGLFYENELVECIGVNTKGTHSKEAELVRLCSKQNTRVLGGFSKLLKASRVKKVVSYIDRATFSGKGYDEVSFEKIKENNPSYFYVRKGLRIPRNHFMRRKIKAKFEKGELKYWNPEETEEVNMYKNGYSRIWNCGTIKVEWTL